MITVNFKNGKSATYNHDEVYAVMKPALEKMACWTKYKSYTSSTGVPKLARQVVESTKVESEESQVVVDADENANEIISQMLATE